MERENRMAIGCCITAEQVPLAEQAGFDFFALPGGWLAALPEDEFAALHQQRSAWKIPCLGLNAAIGTGTRICGPGYDREKARDYSRILCRRASELGVKMIGVGSPNARGSYGAGDFSQEWRDTCQFLQILAGEARPLGIQVAWEPLNEGETPFGYDWAESWSHVQALREKGLDNLWMILDVYHLLLQDFPWSDVLESAPYICQVHLAWPDGKKQRRYPQTEDMPPLRERLAQLRRAGWRSDVSTEVFEGDLAAAGRLLQKELAALREE